jgi:hypothetical protein
MGARTPLADNVLVRKQSLATRFAETAMSHRKRVRPKQTMPPEPQVDKPAVPPPTDGPQWERESNPRREYGEGNYAASKRYNDATERYVESHDVEKEAREAAPNSPDEARELERAEDSARRRAKAEDPLLTRPR